MLSVKVSDLFAEKLFSPSVKCYLENNNNTSLILNTKKWGKYDMKIRFFKTEINNLLIS